MAAPNNGVASGGTAATNHDAPVGSLIVAFVTGWGTANASISTLIDSAGNTYTQLAQNTAVAGIFNGSIWICAKSTVDLPSGGTFKATTSNASTYAIMAYSVSGANGGADKNNSTTATSTSTSLATGTLTVPSQIVFACLVFNAAEGVFTEASGFTTLAHFGTGGGHSFAYQIVSATTTVSYAASWVSSVGYALAIGSVEATADMPQSIGFFSTLYDQPDEGTDGQPEADQDAALLMFANANRAGIYPFAGSSAGAATTALATGRKAPIAGNSVGLATTAMSDLARRPLAGSSTGQGGATASLIRRAPFGGSSGGGSTDTGALGRSGPLAGASAGHSTTTGAAGRRAPLNGLAAGLATASFAAGRKAPFVGRSTGTSATVGDLQGAAASEADAYLVVKRRRRG